MIQTYMPVKQVVPSQVVRIGIELVRFHLVLRDAQVLQEAKVPISKLLSNWNRARC